MNPILALQDLSCLGKCSLTVIHPVLSAMGVPCAVLPTAVLSTHTAFPGPAVRDLSDFAGEALAHWSAIGARFDGILTGYLASPEQALLAQQIADAFSGPETRLIVDPAMADHGKLYSGLTPDLIPAMAGLCRQASLCLPNLTEAALLCGLPPENRTDLDYCRRLARELLAQGCRAVMLTGYQPDGGHVGYYYADPTGESCAALPRLDRSCHGTGDLFAAVVSGALMRGLSPAQGAELAMAFVSRSMAATPADSRWGVAFEGHLGWLAGATEELLHPRSCQTSKIPSEK